MIKILTAKQLEEVAGGEQLIAHSYFVCRMPAGLSFWALVQNEKTTYGNGEMQLCYLGSIDSSGPKRFSGKDKSDYFCIYLAPWRVAELCTPVPASAQLAGGTNAELPS